MNMNNNNKFKATLREVELFGKEIEDRDCGDNTGTVKKLEDGTFTFTYKTFYFNKRQVDKYEVFDTELMIFRRHKHSEHGAKIVRID